MARSMKAPPPEAPKKEKGEFDESTAEKPGQTRTRTEDHGSIDKYRRHQLRGK